MFSMLKTNSVCVLQPQKLPTASCVFLQNVNTGSVAVSSVSFLFQDCFKKRTSHRIVYLEESNNPKSPQMILNNESPTSIQHTLDIISVYCACVVVFTTMFIVPSLGMRCYSFFQVNFSFDNFLKW